MTHEQTQEHQAGVYEHMGDPYGSVQGSVTAWHQPSAPGSRIVRVASAVLRTNGEPLVTVKVPASVPLTDSAALDKLLAEFRARVRQLDAVRLAGR